MCASRCAVCSKSSLQYQSLKYQVLQHVALCVAACLMRHAIISRLPTTSGVSASCSVLQCVVQCVAVCCSVLQCVALYNLGSLRTYRALVLEGSFHKETSHEIKRHIATQCNTPQHTAPPLPHTATHCNTLQHCYLDESLLIVATPSNMATAHCSTLQHTATCCNMLQHAATCCNMLQHSILQCNTLQHTATHCNTLLFKEPTYRSHSIHPNCNQ